MAFVHLRNPEERLLLPHNDTRNLDAILTGFREKGGQLVVIDRPVEDLDITPATWPKGGLGRFLLTTGNRTADGSNSSFESVSIRRKPKEDTQGMPAARHNTSDPGGVVTLQPGEAHAITTLWSAKTGLREVGGLTADLYPDIIELLGEVMSRGVIDQTGDTFRIVPSTP